MGGAHRHRAEIDRDQRRHRRDPAPEPDAPPEPGEPGRGRLLRRAEEPRLDAGLQPGRRRHRREGVVEALEGRPPRVHPRGEGRVARLALGAVRRLLRTEQPQHVLRREARVGVAGALGGQGVVAVDHGPRHSLRLISARLSQVRMVLSGTPKRRARSS